MKIGTKKPVVCGAETSLAERPVGDSRLTSRELSRLALDTNRKHPPFVTVPMRR
jgi:hypothetical protein